MGHLKVIKHQVYFYRAFMVSRKPLAAMRLRVKCDFCRIQETAKGIE